MYFLKDLYIFKHKMIYFIFSVEGGFDWASEITVCQDQVVLAHVGYLRWGYSKSPRHCSDVGIDNTPEVMAQN